MLEIYISGITHVHWWFTSLRWWTAVVSPSLPSSFQAEAWVAAPSYHACFLLFFVPFQSLKSKSSCSSSCVIIWFSISSTLHACVDSKSRPSIFSIKVENGGTPPLVMFSSSQDTCVTISQEIWSTKCELCYTGIYLERSGLYFHSAFYLSSSHWLLLVALSPYNRCCKILRSAEFVIIGLFWTQILHFFSSSRLLSQKMSYSLRTLMSEFAILIYNPFFQSSGMEIF